MVSHQKKNSIKLPIILVGGVLGAKILTRKWENKRKNQDKIPQVAGKREMLYKEFGRLGGPGRPRGKGSEGTYHAGRQKSR